MSNVYPKALSITALTGISSRYSNQGWNKIKWLTEDRVESLILCDTVCLWGHQMQFTCRVKCLSRAPRYSKNTFLVYFPTCGWALQTTSQALQKVKNGIHLYTFLSLLWGFKVLHEKEEGRTGGRCPFWLHFPLCGIKLHFERECCHASHTGRSRGTNRPRFIKQRELLCRMGNAGC